MSKILTLTKLKHCKIERDSIALWLRQRLSRGLSLVLAMALLIPVLAQAESPGDAEGTIASKQAPASQTRKLSLRACFDSADANNNEILVASANLPVAQAAIIIAKAIPNPQFNMIYGWGPSWKYIIAGNGQQFGFSEDIQVAGKRTKKIDVASTTFFQQALQLEAVRFSVHNRVRRAYAELAAAHAYADLIESQRVIAQRLMDISQKRYDAGKAPGSEVMQAKLGVMQFDTQRNQAWGRIVQDSAQLLLLIGECPKVQEAIGIDETPLFRLSVEKTDLVPDPLRVIPELGQVLPVAWRERNDLKAALQQAYVDKKGIALAKTLRIPDPTIGFNYLFSTYQPYQLNYFDPGNVLAYLDGANIPVKANSDNPAIIQQQVNAVYFNSVQNSGSASAGNTNSAPGGAAGPSNTAGAVAPAPNVLASRVPYQSGYQLTVQQESPIFYQYQGQINQAKATWMQQLKQTDQLKAQIAKDIVTAYEELIVTRANIKKFREQVLPAAALVAQLTRRGYELGKMDLATTILAQQQYQQLLSSYFDAVVAYQNAWADEEQAVGLPLNL